MAKSLILAMLTLAAPVQAEEPLSDADRARLENLVLQDCGSCHGLRMTGGLGLPITSDALAGRSPDAMRDIILDGIPGTAMPPWRPLLSEAEAAWIVAFLMEEVR